MKNDPLRVLREHALEPLRAELRATGGPVLFVRGAGCAAELGETPARFAAAWVELDGFEGADAAGLARGVLRALRPGGRLVCVVPGGVPLLATARALLRGDGAAAELRARRAGAAAWRTALAPFVRWRRRRGIGVLLPGGAAWPARHALAFALLGAAEHVLGEWPPLRTLGEWTVCEGVRL